MLFIINTPLTKEKIKKCLRRYEKILMPALRMYFIVYLVLRRSLAANPLSLSPEPPPGTWCLVSVAVKAVAVQRPGSRPDRRCCCVATTDGTDIDITQSTQSSIQTDILFCFHI